MAELSLADYGRTALLISGFNAVTLLAAVGFPPETSRLAARARVFNGDTKAVLRVSLRAAASPAVAGAVLVGVGTYIVDATPRTAVVAFISLPPLVAAVVIAGYVRGIGSPTRGALIQPANFVGQLVALGVFISLYGTLTYRFVFDAFAIGNWCALLVAMLLLVGAHPLSGRPVTSGRGEAPLRYSVREVLGASAWLTATAASVTLLPVFARAAGAVFSLQVVALIDVALLVFAIAERLGTVVTAGMIPAATERAASGAVRMPSRAKKVMLAAGTAFFVVLLAWTDAVPVLLAAFGLARYSAAEPFLLIVLLAAPARILYAVTIGAAVAEGRVRVLSLTAGAVGLVTCVALYVGTYVAPLAIPVVLVIGYWALLTIPDGRPRSPTSSPAQRGLEAVTGR